MHVVSTTGKRIAPDHPPCKSELMLLCERFQQRFGTPNADGRPQEIMLKSAVAQLGVSRRRLYDIINVLEAVEVRVLFFLLVVCVEVCSGGELC